MMEMAEMRDQSERNEECQEVAMNVFILEMCCCLIKGKCCKREHAEVPITIKEHMDSLLSPLWLDIGRRLKKYVYFFIVNGINVRVGGLLREVKGSIDC